MGTRMKTTIEIPGPLLARAKALASREGTTLRELVETGLELVLEAQRQPARFVLRDGSVKGKGLQPAFRDAPWDVVAAAAYEGRGG